MSKQNNFTADYLRSILDYDHETGEFRWKHRPREHFGDNRTFSRCNTMFGGKKAGAVSPLGYVTIGIHGQVYTAHRLAWLWMTGEWPMLDIDHRDGDGLNNKWSNIRLATESQNLMNARLRSDSSTGLKGVWARKRKNRTRFVASISANGKTVYLGTFDSSCEASDARNKAALQIHGEFARSK